MKNFTAGYLFAFLAVWLLATPVSAQTMHPYSDPLYFGAQSDHLHRILERALKRTPWALTEQEDASYMATLSSRGLDIRLRSLFADQGLRFELESVTASGCTTDCVELGDADPVLRWLVSLRRTIAYELTLLIIDG